MSPRGGRRARSSKPEVVTIFWRDIPAQVTATSGDNRVKVLLDARFQYAIDRAAMIADMSDTQSYVAEWRREATTFDGEAQATADSTAQGIEAGYSPERLEQIVRAGGLNNDSSIGAPAIDLAQPAIGAEMAINGAPVTDGA